MEHLFFYIGLAFILTHELDAVQMKEWRIFPLISFLDDKMGYWVFTALHIPLFVAFFYGLRQNPNGTMYGLDIFFMVHIGLHLLLLWHKKNLFTSFFSWFLIVGAGIFGALDLFYFF
jgi:hypothetical protein